MSQFLKQSIACTIMFGPFVDKTDGVTLKTDATTITDIDHATTGIFLSKNGAAAAIRHQGVTPSVADAYGMMKVTLDTTDTGTVGTLDVLFAKAATYLPVHKTFMVLPANVYDALMGTDLLDINAAQWLGTAILAPVVAGTPDVNAKLIGGTSQTGNDVGADVNEILTDTGTTLDGKINTIDDFLDTEIDAIKGVVDKIDTAMELDGAVYRFTENALEEAPGGGDATLANQIKLLQILTGKWEIVNNQLKMYDADGNTVLYTFDLSQDGVATEYNPDLRSPV